MNPIDALIVRLSNTIAAYEMRINTLTSTMGDMAHELEDVKATLKGENEKVKEENEKVKSLLDTIAALEEQLEFAQSEHEAALKAQNPVFTINRE